jgi:Sec-independent protein secretion pathway component TatC
VRQVEARTSADEVFAFHINQLFLLAISLYVAIPAVMVLLSVLLAPGLSRWLNVAFGLLYAATILLSTIGEDYVYYFFLSGL